MQGEAPFNFFPTFHNQFGVQLSLISILYVSYQFSYLFKKSVVFVWNYGSSVSTSVQ
jgi:hypothetical protein